MPNYHQEAFPFKIQNKLKSIEQAHRNNIQMQHVWGVFQAEGAIGYAPPHVPDADYYVVTNESHDCATYYEQEIKS